MVKKQVVNSKEMPTGVKVLSVLGYIGAAVTLLMGLIMIFGAGFIQNNLPSGMIPEIGRAFLGVGLVIAGICALGFAVLDYFVARGLRNGRNWARIFVLIFAVLGLLSSLWPISIVSLVIDGLIVWYL